MDYRRSPITSRIFRTEILIHPFVTCILVLGGFLASDAALVAWAAGVASIPEVFAGVFSYAVISAGLLFTLYAMPELVDKAYRLCFQGNTESDGSGANSSSW